MTTPSRRWIGAGVVALGALASGCNGSSTGGGNPPPPTVGAIIVLNQISHSIQQFNVDGQTLVPFGSPIVLPSNFDGDTFDVLSNLFVTTVSAAGGSQILWVDLGTAQTLTTTFPAPAGVLADPSRPTIVLDNSGQIAALVAGRGVNSVYLAFPSEPIAFLLAEDAGEYIERVLPFGAFIFTVDANLDDSDDLAPLGDSRMEVFRFTDGSAFDEFDLTGATGAIDAVFSQNEITVLAAGSTLPGPPPQPVGDGKVLVVNAPDRGIRRTLDLEGNGVSLEVGRDGRGYVVRTRGSSESTDVVTMNFATASFDRGPSNPIQPQDSDGSDIVNCRNVTSLASGRLLCITYEDAAQGRLVLMDSNGGFLDDISIGAGATDIYVR